MIPLAEVQPRCEFCAHWQQHDEPGSGDCLRYPPVIVYEPDQGAFTLCPSTEAADRCGEFKAVF